MDPWLVAVVAFVVGAFVVSKTIDAWRESRSLKSAGNSPTAVRHAVELGVTVETPQAEIEARAQEIIARYGDAILNTDNPELHSLFERKRKAAEEALRFFRERQGKPQR